MNAFSNFSSLNAHNARVFIFFIWLLYKTHTNNPSHIVFIRRNEQQALDEKKKKIKVRCAWLLHARIFRLWGFLFFFLCKICGLLKCDTQLSQHVVHTFRWDFAFNVHFHKVEWNNFFFIYVCQRNHPVDRQPTKKKQTKLNLKTFCTIVSELIEIFSTKRINS